MRQMNEKRRRVVVVCAAIASMSGVGPLLARRHPKLMLVWLGLMVVGLGYAMVQLTALKRGDC